MDKAVQIVYRLGVAAIWLVALWGFLQVLWGYFVVKDGYGLPVILALLGVLILVWIALHRWRWLLGLKKSAKG